MWNCYWNYHYVLQGEMKGHENKYDWTFKDEDTYTLTIKNPTVDEEGTYNVSGHSLIYPFLRRSQYFQSEKSKTFLRIFGDMHGFHPAMTVFDNHDIPFDFSSHNI